LTVDESHTRDQRAAPRPPEKTVVVVPCFNEAARLDVNALVEFGGSRDWLELILVDDGSSDDTKATIQGAVRRAPDTIRALFLESNHGKAEAVRRGILAALEDDACFVGFWDADLATPLSDIGNFRRRLQQDPEIQIVMGSRVKLMGTEIERSELRHYFGRIAATAVSRILGIPVYDTQCGAKLFRAGTGLQEIFADPFVTRWAFDVEILARWLVARDEGIEANRAILEVPLRRWVDVPGTKLRAVDFLRAPVDIWRIRRAYRAAIRRRARD
jgi:glycosyltransferase involved in cell wall biosynthesis